MRARLCLMLIQKRTFHLNHDESICYRDRHNVNNVLSLLYTSRMYEQQTNRGASVLAALVFVALIGTLALLVSIVAPTSEAYAQAAAAGARRSPWSENTTQRVQSVFSSTHVPAGNALPKASGSCVRGYVCANSMLYIRSDNCLDQPVRFCEGGCESNRCVRPRAL